MCHNAPVKLTGDPEAIEVLKAQHKKTEGFLKALLEDARSTTDHTTYFRDEEGERYKLTFDPSSGGLCIERAPARKSLV